jgi:uncharacterized protein YqeY
MSRRCAPVALLSGRSRRFLLELWEPEGEHAAHDPAHDPMNLKARIQDDIKTAMKARESERLAALRLVSAAIKQREVDERIDMQDADVLAVLEKMVKQRRESISQFDAAGRQDLADKERFELTVIAAYLPEPLDAAGLEAAVKAAIAEAGATSARDMGAVMALLRPRLLGRADMAAVSQQVKALLAG